MTAPPRTSSLRAAAMAATALLALVVPGAPAAGPGDPAAVAARAGWAKRGLDAWPGRVAGRRLLVRFRRGVDRRQARALLSSWGGELGARVPLAGADVVHVPAGLSVARALARLEASPLVAHAEPDHLVFPAAPPEDPRFDQQWGLRNTGQPHPVAGAPGTVARGRPGADIRAVPAWDASPGGGRPVIAVVDSGVDVRHPELDANLWTNPGETPGNGVDDDGNGYRDDVHGWDFARGRAALLEARPYDGWNHGTHVAGIAAAEHNGVGVAGVCPTCRVMVLKFMRPVDTDGDNRPDTMAGTLSAELRALGYAAAMGARVVNASYGSAVWSSLERRAFARLARRGILSVAAAGNENGDNDMYLFLDFDNNGIPDSISPAYPATYDLASIVSVAASNHGDRYG
ncbi:MAG TPA: S8 family serine peptidase, partial [Actinomycetota bacterium]|nr:S8 family serine peptidase [Actinomycetota bacterium]